MTLKAINLGENTDTTGAATGGLAGILYGFDTILKSWLQQIARKANIEDLADSLLEVASRLQKFWQKQQTIELFLSFGFFNFIFTYIPAKLSSITLIFSSASAFFFCSSATTSGLAF